jgi:hypothetical protein
MFDGRGRALAGSGVPMAKPGMVARNPVGVVCQISGWHTTWHSTRSHAMRIAKEFAWFWPLALLRWLAIVGYESKPADPRVFARRAARAILVAGFLLVGASALRVARPWKSNETLSGRIGPTQGGCLNQVFAFDVKLVL